MAPPKRVIDAKRPSPFRVGQEVVLYRLPERRLGFGLLDKIKSITRGVATLERAPSKFWVVWTNLGEMPGHEVADHRQERMAPTTPEWHRARQEIQERGRPKGIAQR